MDHYPKWKYHPDKGAELVDCKEDEKAMGQGWFESPAEFGVETCQSKKPDPAIAKKKPAGK